MGKYISELPDELLIKILSFLPTSFAVSTSILSKQWKFLWMWSPNLHYIRDYKHSKSALPDIIDKNLTIHRAPVIESFHLDFRFVSFEPEDIKKWVRIAVSRRVRELHLNFYKYSDFPLPSSLYTCTSLVSLKLDGDCILDVPPKGFLPSLKTLQLLRVTYANKDSLGLFLSYCPVLEDLNIERYEDDNVRSLVVTVQSLQRLSLSIGRGCSSDGYVIDTSSLKYFEVKDYRDRFSYLIEDMPKLEEAYIYGYKYNHKYIAKLVESTTSVKRLSLGMRLPWNTPAYGAGIVFDQLEHLTICINGDNWSKLVIRFLRDSPKLRVLNLRMFFYAQRGKYQSVSWNNVHTSVPECLLKSLESFKFEGYQGRQEERDFLSFLFKYACCLKASSIS